MYVLWRKKEKSAEREKERKARETEGDGENSAERKTRELDGGMAVGRGLPADGVNSTLYRRAAYFSFHPPRE